MQICFSESISQGTRPKTVGARIGPRNQTQNEVLELYHPSVSNKDLIYDGMWLLILCYCAVIKTFIGHVLGYVPVERDTQAGAMAQVFQGHREVGIIRKMRLDEAING